MKVLDMNQVQEVNGGWAWVAAGGAASVASYVGSTPKEKRTVRGYATAAATGMAGGGAAKAGQMAWKAGQKIIATKFAGQSVGMGYISGAASR